MSIDLLYDRRDLSQAMLIEMLALPHHLQYIDKQFKVPLLGRPQRVLTEEGNDLLAEVLHRTHTEAIQVFFVVVVAAIDVDSTAAEELLKCLESE